MAALAAVVGEDVVWSDHPLAVRTPLIGAEYLTSVQEGFTEVPDASWTVTAVHAVTGRAILFSDEASGSRDGSPFVVPRVGAPSSSTTGSSRCTPTPTSTGRRPRPGSRSSSAGPQENLAVRAVRAGNDVGLAGNWEAVGAGVHPDVVLTDRRPLLGGFRAEGAAAYVDFVRSVFAMGVDSVTIEVRVRRGHHLALVHVVHSGPMGSLPTLQIVELDPGCRHILRHDVYDPSQLAEAMAVLGPEENLAARVIIRTTQLILEGRLEEAALVNRPDFVMRDHRPVIGGELSGPEFEDTANALWRWQFDRFTWQVLEQHGQHLALLRGLFGGAGAEVEALLLIEVDDEGRYRRLDVFDADQADLAQTAFREGAALEGGRALLEEGLDALLVVVAAHVLLEEPVGDLDGGADVAVEVGVELALGGDDRRRADLVGEHPGVLVGGGQELVGREHPVHEAQLGGLLGQHHPRREEQVGGAAQRR